MSACFRGHYSHEIANLAQKKDWSLTHVSDRFSGLWGAQTPLGLYLQETGITTLFISGVNSDQCVWSTLIDAFFKGFDIVYVEDCTATTSPWFAEEMARYNADYNGFLANSTVVIEALKKQLMMPNATSAGNMTYGTNMTNVTSHSYGPPKRLN